MSQRFSQGGSRVGVLQRASCSPLVLMSFHDCWWIVTRDTAYMAARNHHLQISPSGFDARIHDVPVDKEICVTADVQEHEWLILCSLLSTSVWLTSPPCPAFSLASNMLGFLRKEGKNDSSFGMLCTFVSAYCQLPSKMSRD